MAVRVMARASNEEVGGESTVPSWFFLAACTGCAYWQAEVRDSVRSLHDSRLETPSALT